jgi:endonuclease/exonuclease/phosphatase family metal-dependent hydrolase
MSQTNAQVFERVRSGRRISVAPATGIDPRGKSFYTREETIAEPGPPGTPPRLRAVAYNIHKGIGGIDRLYRIERVIEVLRRMDADFLLLQEVDEGVPRSSRERQVDAIADALGLRHRLFGPNVRLSEGVYGNAILSRFPLDHHENIDLTISPKKRRSALHARLTVEHGRRKTRLWLFDVHLGLSGLERRAQLRYLLEWIRFRHPAEDTGIVLGGDFNDVFDRLGSLLLIPAGYRTTSHTLLTFPARRPLRPLDKVFLRGPLTASRFQRADDELARQASDHLPVLCDFELI